MEDLFEDTESEPHHFIVLDSQDTQNIPPSWDDTSILKSLPALRIPETQYVFELTTISETSLSPIHNFEVSETYLFDSELVDSCNFNLIKSRRKIMDDQHIVIDETCSQGSSTSDSSGNFGRSLNQSMIENPKFDEKAKSSKSSNEKVLSVKEYKESSDTKTNKDIPSTSLSQKMSKETDLTVLARQSLFKNYQEDTESDEKEPNRVVCTPSKHIGSLQFSQESMLVPDTADEMNYIEPSPEYNPTPTIIPDSPTLSLSEESDDDTQDPTMIETTIMKQKESENLDTTVEPVAENSVKESQNFQLLYLDTQASEVSQVERRVSPEKPMVREEPKREEEHSRHDNSEIMSESQDLNLHLSFNTEKDAASQRSSLSGKMSISQSPATPKDNSNEEVKFKLILPSNVHSPSNISQDETSKTHFEGSSSTSHKSNLPETLGTSQQEVSQGMSSAQYKIKSQEKVADPKTVQSQEGLPEMTGSQKINFPDVLPDAQKRDSTVVFAKFHKVGSQDVEFGSQKGDSPAESQKGHSQNVAPSSQKGDSPAGSQKDYSQNVAPSSQKGDSPAGSQKDYSQNVAPSSQKGDSPAESQKGYSQKVIPTSQKEDSPAESQKDYSQNVAPSSQKGDSPAESQKGYSQKVIPTSQKEDSPAESQKDYSQNVAPSSQKGDSPAESQKGYSQKVIPTSQKEDSPAESQKGYSQNVAPSSQKGDSPAESQKGYSQKVIPTSQKRDSPSGSQKDYSQNVAPSSQKGDSPLGSQKDYLQNKNSQSANNRDMSTGSQKKSSQNTPTTSQQEHFHGMVPGSQKQENPETISGSQERIFQRFGSQSKNIPEMASGPAGRSSESILLGSQKEDMFPKGLKLKENSSDTLAGFKKRDSQDVTVGSQKESSSDVHVSQIVKQKEETSGISQRENSQDISTDSQKKNTQDMPGNSQNKDSQEMVSLSQREQLQETSSNSQKGYSQSMSFFAQREPSQTGSQIGNSQGVLSLSQKEDSPDNVSKSQKENSQGLMPRSQKEDSQGMVRNPLDISAEFQKKNSQSLILRKGNSQDMSVSLQKNSQGLSEKEKSLGMSAHSQKEDSQHTLPGSSVSQEKNSYLQAGSQSHILPHGSHKEKTQDLSVDSQETKSQPAMPAISEGVEIPAMPKADSQSRISAMDSPNVLVTEISTDSPNKDTKSLKSSCQKRSHSQPSDSEVSGSYNSNLHGIKQYSSSLDSGLPHLTNVEPLVSPPKRAACVSERPSPTDKATQDPSNPLLVTEELASVDSQNLKQTPEKIIAIPLGSVSNFHCVSSSTKHQDSAKKEAISTSQPSTLKGTYPEHTYQIRADSCKKSASEENLPSSSSAKFETQEWQKGLKPSVSHELDPLKILSLPDTESQEPGKDTLNDKETSEKSASVTASPEKMEVDFVAIELPSKPNICYLKDSQHSQGSSTITLSQNHQFEIYSSQMAVSQKLNKNSKEVSHPSIHTAYDKNLVSNPNHECSQILTSATENLTLIKPKCKRGISELHEASSTMYPSQTSASQQRRTPSLEVQPQHTVTSRVARYNISSVQPDTKTEQPLAGPSNDPYLFIGSQPKTIQTVESRKKQRRSKVLSKFTQKRIQKKSIPKKKSSLSGRNWTIRKDYKSPVHRVRFEPLRRRTASMKLLKDDPIFLKVPSYKDIETIFSKKDNLKEQVKSSCSSDGSTQLSTNKESQHHQVLFSNLQNVLQRKIVEETVVQLVYRKTTIETVKNSKVVDSRTIVEKDEPSIIRSTRSEDFKYLNSAKGVSPFCSPNSLTSGEYADVSSLSHSDSKTSNSSSFGSLITKPSTFEVPMSPLVRHSDRQSKKYNLSGPQGGQPVTLGQLQSPGTDDDLLKVPSPITSVYKDAHSVYCSSEELHAVNQSCEDGRSYVTVTVPTLEASSGDPAKSRATVVQNSDSLFSSAEILNISDSGPPSTMAGQETVMEATQLGKGGGQSSVDSLGQEADQSITLHIESAETSENDLRTPPASQKWSSPQKRKASDSEENSEETSIDKPPPQKRLRKDSEEGISLQQTKNSEEGGSPEISPQDYQQQIKMPSLSPESSKKGKTGIGVKVMAKWKDGFFYPGITASQEKGGKCLINFADGDQLWVKINQILIVNYLPQGQSVMVQSKDNFFDSGMIVDHIDIDSDSADSFIYRIEMDDNTTVTCTRQQVILSEDQASVLLSDEEYQMTCTIPSTPQPSGADVSLDNLVEGSRRSGKKVEVSSEKMESSKRTKLMRMEPQAMSTPTPKRKTKSLKKGFMAHLNLVPTAEPWSSDKKLKLCNSKGPESLIGAAVSSPKSQKYDKTRHVKKELFDAVKGPIPKQKNLFKGMNFLLTHTEKTPEQKLLDKKMIQEFSSESSPNPSDSDIDEPEVPFDKHHLQAQIEAGGGTVFDSWSDKLISKKTKSFIISSSYQRTIKYLQGLAAGIPCVSYLWIRDCCKQGISSDYRAYMLQAGISLKKKNLIECKLKPQCLDDTQVLLFSTNSDFVSTWSEILTLAGCNVVKKFKKSRDQSRDVDIVITDNTCSAHIRKQAEIYNTPLLSTEWVIQCLIHGQKLCYTGHEKYKFDYEEQN